MRQKIGRQFQYRRWAAVALFIILAPVGARDLRLVTINVWSGLDYVGNVRMGEYESAAVREQRYQLLLAELRALDPDAVALNEANCLPRYARRIARDLGYDTVYHLGLGGLRVGPLGLPLNLREGDVLLAKPALHLRPAGRCQLSGGYVGRCCTCHFSDATQVVAARITVDDRPLYLFVTHWHASAFADEATLSGLTGDYLSGRIAAAGYLRVVQEAVGGNAWRVGEARKMVEFVDRVAGTQPAVLLGDFNDVSGSQSLQILADAGFRDSYATVNSDPGYTWDEWRNTNIIRHYFGGRADTLDGVRKRIDFIFTRGPEITVRQAREVCDRPTDGLLPSDHFGVLTEIAFPAE